MEKPVIYHHPRCSKSRALLQLLRQRDIDPRVILYLVDPPGREQLLELVKKLDLPVRDLIRTSEAAYRDLQLDGPQVTDEMLLAALAEHPILLQRPILVVGDRAAIGRPPEAALELLSQG